MQNFNAQWRAGPFEVDRWMQKPELNIKRSFTLLDSLSLGGCKGGINRLLCQAGGATPVVLVVSRQAQKSEPDTRQQASIKKVFTLWKKENTPPSDAKRSEMYADWV